MALTRKEQIFCKEYIIDFNGTRSAKKAGYSEKSAYAIASENLRKLDIQDEINKQINKRKQRLQVSQDRLIAELKKIAYSDISDFYEISPDGIVLKDLDKIDTSVIKEVQEVTNSSEKSFNKNIKLKLEDKLKALELLGKHIGAFTDKIDLTTKERKIITFKEYAEKQGEGK